ncbi:MAG: PIN domain-containing protein [Synergistaceae bacterium]|nr:PIN domain-containing protein [Synergistaceae bacterium]
MLDKEYAKSAISLGRIYSNGFADSYLAATAKDHSFDVVSFDESHFKKLDVVLCEI